MWEVLDEHNAVIQFHTSPPFADQIDEIATRHPGIKLLIDHMGYPNLDEGPGPWQPIVDLSRHPICA